MEVHHKAKPWHGWREFLREYVVIVVGVLTALAAGAIADDLHWAERTRETKEHLRAEVRLIAVEAWARLGFEPCERAMIGAVEQALVQGRGGEWKSPYLITLRFAGRTVDTPAGPWALTDTRSVIEATPERWDTQAWRDAQADGTANHLTQKDNVAFGRLYETVGRAKALSDELFQDGSELNALANPQRLDPASRAGYLRVLGRVRGELSSSILLYSEILQRAGRLGIANPHLEEAGEMVPIRQAVCRQFREGRTEIVWDVPEAAVTQPEPLPPE